MPRPHLVRGMRVPFHRLTLVHADIENVLSSRRDLPRPPDQSEQAETRDVTPKPETLAAKIVCKDAHRNLVLRWNLVNLRADGRDNSGSRLVNVALFGRESENVSCRVRLATESSLQHIGGNQLQEAFSHLVFAQEEHLRAIPADTSYNAFPRTPQTDICTPFRVFEGRSTEK